MRHWFTCVFLYFVIFFASGTSLAQKKLVIMGSSTAAGAGASPGNSWAAKIEAYFRQNMADGLDTITINIALGGYNTYLEMPTGYVPPPGRPFPDPNANVTKALSFTPDVVIINLPSNDIAVGFTKKECMDNFRLMFTTINATGAKCFIATTQPRNLDLAGRTALRELVDSINNNFGIRAINFWSDLVSPLTDPANIYTINPPVSVGDGIHINDLGHNYLFIRVRDRQIFASNAPLPLFLKDFQVYSKNNSVFIKWLTEQEDPNTFFEIQRSRDGLNFECLYRQPGRGINQGSSYSWTDYHPLADKGFYRLKIIETNRESFSKIVSIQNKISGVNVSKLYKDNLSSILFAEISIQKSQSVLIHIINAAGASAYQQSQYITSPSKMIVLPIEKLPAGQYFLSIRTLSNSSATVGFIK